MEKPKIAILDGDILAYRASFWAEAEGIEYLEGRLMDDVDLWTPHGMDKVIIALSCSRVDNFRRDTWPDYKMHREDTHTPEGLREALTCLKDQFDVRRAPRLEADDMMGIMMSSGKGVAVSIDKDMLTVPGWLWNPDKMKTGPELITEEEADFRYHVQWIMGDTTDNYKGIYRWGPKKAEKYLKASLEEGLALSEAVRKLYAEHDLDDDYCEAMGICARILRHDEWVDGLPLPKVGVGSTTPAEYTNE